MIKLYNDVAIQSLPVRFAIDRAGQVGADGATHAGSFDLTYLAPYQTLLLWLQVVKTNCAIVSQHLY